ncbi:FecR domain-containing protein [Piscinibacter sp.]|uniref:FecR domain-containing protein n=1 Tax=Piscinibacter sp. TaxID=1903157 RepID=UPI0039E355C3
MTEPEAAGAPSEQILRQAAEWFAVLGGAPGEREREAWRRWLQADPRHARAWQRVEALNQGFEDLPPGIDRHAAVQALTRARRVNTSRRRALGTLAGVGFAGAAGWLVAQQDWNADARTAVGERREMRLADGTRLWLNTDTALRIRYTAQERAVQLLRGELLVATAEDTAVPSRPWRLDLAACGLSPVGTRFSARRNGDDGSLCVFEGAVDVAHAAGAAPRRVPAGRQLRFDRSSLGDAQPATPEADAWTRGMLVADGWPLAAFCAELARYQRGWLSCADDAAALRIVGAFPLDDLDQVYRLLERTLPVRVERPLPGWVRVVAA